MSIGKTEEILSESSWLAGRDYSLADLNCYSMAAGVKRLQSEILNKDDIRRTRERLRRKQDRPAVQAAQVMPNEVPETLRTFGG